MNLKRVYGLLPVKSPLCALPSCVCRTVSGKVIGVLDGDIVEVLVDKKPKT
jgi:hypothetical protein